MGKPGRKATRVCKRYTFYLSSEAIAKLARLSKGRKSAYLDKLIIDTYNSTQGSLDQEEKRIEELLTIEGGNLTNSVL